MKLLHAVAIFAVLIFTQACSHPLDIVGEGDITSASGNRNCTLEDHAAELDNCTKNFVIGDYAETYFATPRTGWLFDRWGNYCVDVEINECSFDIGAELTDLLWGQTMPPLQAVFSKHKVTGPVLPHTGIALLSGPDNLAALGYEKIEYFIEGNAHSYFLFPRGQVSHFPQAVTLPPKLRLTLAVYTYGNEKMDMGGNWET